MRCNTDPSFVGLEGLIRTHAEQIAPFEGWAAAGDWERFHRSHYDWWVFPVDRRSSWGLQWTVCESEVARLKEDEPFLGRYARGVELIAASWSWDVSAAAPTPDPDPGREVPEPVLCAGRSAARNRRREYAAPVRPRLSAGR